MAERNVEAWRRRAQSGAGAASAVGWVELDQALAEQAAAATRNATWPSGRSLACKELHGARPAQPHRAARRGGGRGEAPGLGPTPRQRRIRVLGTVADTELTRARQRLDAAKAKLRALGGEAGAGWRRAASQRVVVRSPIAGVVARRDLTRGRRRSRRPRRFSPIADLTRGVGDGRAVRQGPRGRAPGQPATVRVQGLGDAVVQGPRDPGRPQVDEKTRTLPVRIAVRNPALGQREPSRSGPGMFATVALETSRKPCALVVSRPPPSRPLDGQPVVFVETPLSDGRRLPAPPGEAGRPRRDVVEVVEGL